MKDSKTTPVTPRLEAIDEMRKDNTSRHEVIVETKITSGLEVIDEREHWDDVFISAVTTD